MDKPQKLNPLHYSAPTNKKCSVCDRETQIDCIFTEMARYSKQSGNLMMVSRMACLRCRDQINSVRYFVEKNGLKFGKDSKVFIDNVLPFLNHDQASRIQQNVLYQRSIQQQIKRSKIYHEGSLPQNCLQLIYYCSFGISHAERHEKIRNIIKQAMIQSPINYANLADVAVLVHCLICFMSESNITLLLRNIMNNNLVEGSPFQEQIDEDYQLPVDPLWRCIYKDIHIGNFIVAISALVRNHSQSKKNFQTIKKNQYIIQQQNLAQFFKEKLKLKGNLNIRCSQNWMNLQFLDTIYRQKNNMNLILKSMMKQQKCLKQHIAQLQFRHNKEKNQYINKIIKLRDKIQILEKNYQMSLPGDLKDEIVEDYITELDQYQTYSKHNRSKSITQDKLGIYKNQAYKQQNIIQQIEEASQNSSRHLIVEENPHKVCESNGKTNETEPSNNYVQTGNKYIDQRVFKNMLHKLLSHSKQINPHLLSDQAQIETIIDNLDEQMKNLRSTLQVLEKKTKNLDAQSKRLLDILTRKQQIFMPLIHEKDEIIERYENVLWKMENCKPIEDEHLGPRIGLIIRKYQQYILDIGSELDSVSQGQDLRCDQRSERQMKKKNVESNNRDASSVNNETQIEKPNVKQEKAGKKSKKKKTSSKLNENIQETKDKQCVIF